MKKKKLYIWFSDLRNDNGEGILGKKFLSDLKKYNKNIIFVVRKSSLENINFSINVLNSLKDRFFLPLSGIIYLWFIYFFKSNKKLCYVNFLPLWNFLIFALLPPNTILGPITGGSKYLKKPIINYFLRKYVLNFFCYLSIKILNLRQIKLLFSTDLLKKKFKNSKKNKFNYVLNDLKYNDKNLSREIDIVFYLRSHKNKNTNIIINLANYLSNKYKVVTVGEKIKNKNIINMGKINQKKLYNILQKTKYSFLSAENIYSFFSLDCLSNGVHVFYHRSYSPLTSLKKNMTAVNYYRLDVVKKLLEKKLKKTFKKQKKIIFKSKQDFSDYFKL